MNTKVLFILLTLTSLPALADELDLNQWYQLHLQVEQYQKEDAQNGYIPTHIQAVTSKEGVYQQVFNYNLEQWKASSQTWKSIDKNWVARSTDSNSNPPPAATGQTVDHKVTYEIRPIETKGAVEIKDVLKATFNYQIWNHSAEVRVTPVHAYHGVGLAVSHTVNSDEQRTQLLVQLSW